jgi:hypothetical protein
MRTEKKEEKKTKEEMGLYSIEIDHYTTYILANGEGFYTYSKF